MFQKSHDRSSSSKRFLLKRAAPAHCAQASSLYRIQKLLRGVLSSPPVRPSGIDRERAFNIESLVLVFGPRVESAGREVHDDGKSKSSQLRRQPVRGQWSGAGSADSWGDVRVGLLRKSG